MTATYKGVSAPTHELFVDSLDSEIEESLKDPQYRAAYEDSSDRYAVIDRLILMRKGRNLTQKQVADRMGVGQSTIAGFENEGSDPRLSTVQRYARAVEARCVVTIQVAIESDWVKPSVKYEKSTGSGPTTRVDSTPASALSVAWGVADSIRASFALCA
jgi:transcriptional regulator with XRE-family HTH domain